MDEDGKKHAWGIGPPAKGYFDPISSNNWSPFEHKLPETEENADIIYTSFDALLRLPETKQSMVLSSTTNQTMDFTQYLSFN